MTVRAKHTPGPWLNEGSRRNTGAIDDSCVIKYKDDFVATAWQGKERSSEETFANARLIAASPKLLEALELAIRCLNDIPNTKTSAGMSYEVISKLGEASKEAKGE